MNFHGDVPDSAVVTFGRGLPGLDAREFAILKPDGLEPIVMLQSVDNPASGRTWPRLLSRKPGESTQIDAKQSEVTEKNQLC